MPNERLWDAVATIEVDGKKAGPFRLHKTDAVTIGRSGRAGLHSPSRRIEMPRELARLRRTKSGWVLENEGTTVGRAPKSVTVIGPDIKSRNGAIFGPHAWVLMGRGTWVLRWDVGVTVTVLLRPPHEDDEGIDEAADQPRRGVGMATLMAEPVKLSALERRNMAALFAYLIRDEPEPREIYTQAAKVLGGDVETRGKNRTLIKAQLPKVATKINQMRARQGGISSADEIGRFLVEVTKTLGIEDLED